VLVGARPVVVSGEFVFVTDELWKLAGVGAVFELPCCAAVPCPLPVVCTLPEGVAGPCGEGDSSWFVPFGEDPEFGDEVGQEFFPVVVACELGLLGNWLAEGFGVPDVVEG
jgi:hypothetical protein